MTGNLSLFSQNEPESSFRLKVPMDLVQVVTIRYTVSSEEDGLAKQPLQESQENDALKAPGGRRPG
jgi:hypothetical protein